MLSVEIQTRKLCCARRFSFSINTTVCVIFDVELLVDFANEFHHKCQDIVDRCISQKSKRGGRTSTCHLVLIEFSQTGSTLLWASPLNPARGTAHYAPEIQLPAHKQSEPIKVGVVPFQKVLSSLRDFCELLLIDSIRVFSEISTSNSTTIEEQVEDARTMTAETTTKPSIRMRRRISVAATSVRRNSTKFWTDTLNELAMGHLTINDFNRPLTFCQEMVKSPTTPHVLRDAVIYQPSGQPKQAMIDGKSLLKFQSYLFDRFRRVLASNFSS